MVFSSQHPLSVAPMMDYTDRHFRFFMRQLTRQTLLYTEMVTSAAILHGDRDRLLGFSEPEKPLILQMGGDNPHDLAECSRIAEGMGYDGVNLNVGCPSSRVQDGHFGACLMAKPDHVARCIDAMQSATTLPVSVKHRIGIDDCDRYEDLANFVQIVSSVCQFFTVHARKAWLKGLNPKENRTIPPLRYEDVYQLKQSFPGLWIEINGGILTLEQAQTHLQHVDAVMIGRAAYDNPYVFAEADQQFYGDDTKVRSRSEVALAMVPYIDDWVGRGLKLNKITRHMLQLFSGQLGSRQWKRLLTENSSIVGADSAVIMDALQVVVKDVYSNVGT
jgi:tRNA-dihydrouridine synthase A